MYHEPTQQELLLICQQMMTAGALGLAMAREAVRIFNRHRTADWLTSIDSDGMAHLSCQIPQPDGAVFTAILDAEADCRELFDEGQQDERRSDALRALMDMAAFGEMVESQLAAQGLRQVPPT